MYTIDAVQRDYSPRERIAGRLPELPARIKMYEQDSAFVCGLVEMFRPQKIVEVGIADGGTSAVLMQCLHDLGLSSSIYCVDIREESFGSSEQEIGYLGRAASQLLPFENYHLLKGSYLPQVIDQIGGEIDFLILDTVHKLPGETLDFLAAYPYLKENAVVCMHDIIQNLKTPPDRKRIATNALMSSVAADKYLDTDPTRIAGYPNIGAFRMNRDTDKYITNVFGVLTQNWSYSLPPDLLKEYTRIIHSSFSEEARWIFDCAVEMNSGSPEPDTQEEPSVLHRLIRKLKAGRIPFFQKKP